MRIESNGHIIYAVRGTTVIKVAEAENEKIAEQLARRYRYCGYWCILAVIQALFLFSIGVHDLWN